MIFYDRWMFSHNLGLAEIKDVKFLAELKADFNRNFVNYKSMTPIICGTVVNKSHYQKTFDRKLKMLRCTLFSLLQICQSKEFITKKNEQTNSIKEGIIKYL